MKKFYVVLLSLIMCFVSICFVGCGDKETQAELIDLADCDIGYQLTCYPQCNFSYKLDENFIVNIDSFSATLIEKHEIHEGDILDDDFYPYAVKVTATGTTDTVNANKKVYFSFMCSYGVGSGMEAIVDSTGHISWETTINPHSNFVIRFYKVLVR